MDDLEKKLLLQLDDDMPGVRQNALDALRERLKFRDIIADFEKAMPAAKKAAELEQRLAEFVEANAAAEKRDADQRSEIEDQKKEIKKLKAELKAALWIKTNWKIWVPALAGLLVIVTGY